MRYKLPVYGNKTLKVAFEFGLVLSEVSKDKGIDLTSEISARAEEVLIKELKENGLEKTALNFVPLVMAVLEV